MSQTCEGPAPAENATANRKLLAVDHTAGADSVGTPTSSPLRAVLDTEGPPLSRKQRIAVAGRLLADDTAEVGR